jgi:hypothetical protein
MMKATVALEIGNRQVVEQLAVDADNRQTFRNMMSEMACRIELATFGPQGPVAEMTAEDKPVFFRDK